MTRQPSIKSSWWCVWTLGKVIVMWLILVTIMPTDVTSTHVCTRRKSRTLHDVTVYYSVSSNYRYRCGGWGRKCNGVRYHQASRIGSRIGYYTEHYCCPGYIGHPPNCQLQPGVCTRRHLSHTEYRTRTVYGTESSNYRYRCGGWGRKCNGVRYRQTTRVEYYPVPLYEIEHYCCPGYSGHPPNCHR